MPSSVRLISVDPSGVTLRLDLDSWSVSPPDADGRSFILAPGLRMLDQPGRPQLPCATALIAVPPGARASAAVIASTTESRDGVSARIGPRNGFEADRSAMRYHAVITPLPPASDQPWPESEITVGEPFELRGQRIAAVELHPFLYDESSKRLTVRRSMTVRVTFIGGSTRTGVAAPPDRFVEPVLRGALLNYDQGRTFRTARAMPSRGRLLDSRSARRGANGAFAFDEGQTEVRVKIDTTGVWGLTFDDLSAAGFPAGVPDSELSVHRHEFLQDQTPPYATIELPIEVQDYNHNGVFDSGDQIVVFVQDWAKRSGATIPERAWGDAEVVYATYLPGRAGLRVGSRSADPSRTGLTPLASYPYTQRFEHNTGEYFSFPPDTLTDLLLWTSFMTYFDRSDSITFETNQIDTTHAVSFSIELQGRKLEPHYTMGTVKNRLGLVTTIYDSTTGYWFGSTDFNTTGTLHGSALTEGLTNHLGLIGKNDNSPPDPTVNYSTGAVLNWFDLTYWRRFQPLRNYLDCNSADASSPYEIFASIFDDSTFLRAWDVTDPLTPTELAGARAEKVGTLWGLRFQDSTAAGRRNYVVFSQPKYPPSDHYGAVTRRSLENHVAGDYLLITPEAFLSSVQPLVDERQREGLNVIVAPLESINDEFNGGRHADFAVKRFIRYAYYHWGTRFVTLLGDGAAEDPQNVLGGSTPDWIPTHRVLGPVGIFIAGSNSNEIVPSDNWYGWCIDDAGCPDPATKAKVLDVYVGRIPVNSLAQAVSAVHKLVLYEQVSPSDLWRRRIELQSDDDYSGENTFGGGATFGYCQRDYERIFATLNAVCRNVIVNEAGLRDAEPELLNLGDYMTGLDLVITPCGFPGCQPDTCRADRSAAQTLARNTFTPALFTRLNDGRLWWNYQGHANEQLLSHESFYVDNKTTIDDTQRYTNSGKPFFFSAFSCHANNFGRRYELGLNGFAPGQGLGSDMVTQANDQGAIASWASSGFELVPTNPLDHLNVEMTRDLFSTPPRDPDLGDRGARVVLGEALALTLLRWQVSPSANLGEREVGVTYTLLGDPATRLSIGSAQALVTANGDTVVNGQPVRLTTPGDTLRLEADLVSNQQIVSIELDQSIDGGTPTVIPSSSYTLTPAFGDTATGGRRYHLVYQTSLTLNSYVFTIHTVDREGTPGTFDAVFPYQCVLRAEGSPINDGDAVSPNANLSLLVVAPAPIHPGTDLQLTLNGQAIAFDSTKVAGDPSGRQWILTWSHGPYPIDSYDLRLATSGGATCTHRFRVNIGGGELRLQNAMAFPNPFDDSGTYLSFTLESGAPSDILIRVYTLTGRLVYTRTERQLIPGYHQLPWDGRDAEGSTIANGIYVYKLVANNGTSSAAHEGRLVKLRRPRHVDIP
ncbi:MAG TPA: C25 family cysteine peptidase [Candidatus Udaeobacter sp.]|nr:C25 family cysteine peptidase [Candidatus Udaeobacter sp.]